MQGLRTRVLASLEKTLLEDLLGAVEHEDELEVDLGGHLALPGLVVLLVSGESIDEELLGGAPLHGVLEEGHGDLRRHDLALLDHALDHLTMLRTAGLLLAQQVTGGQMDESKVLHNAGAVGALARAGSTQHKYHGRLLYALH